MGIAIMMGHCVICTKPMVFNPHKVPSLRILGKREPVCKQCIDEANPIREKAGLARIEILPGAYDPIDESEL